MKLIIKFLIIGFVSSCTIGRPLSGPGFNDNLNQLNGDPNRTVVIAVTNALLDRRKRSEFDDRTQELYKNLHKNTGYIAGSIRLRLLGNEVWTYTIWENEDSLKSFVKSREHLDAMYKTDSAIEKMRSFSQKMLAKKIPTKWEEIEQLIELIEMKNYQPI